MTHATHQFEPRQGYLSAASRLRVDAFIAKTLSLVETLRETRDYTPTNALLHAQLDDYQKEIRRQHPRSDSENTAILRHPVVIAYRSELNQGFARVMRDTKIFHAAAKKVNPNINSVLGHDYDQQINWELASLPLREKPMRDRDRLMFMGAGALPIGAIKMCLKMGRKGTCVSDDEEEVYWGKRHGAETGYDKVISYHLVEYRSGWAYEHHPLLIACNPSLDNFEAFRNNSEARWAEEGVVRDAVGLNTILRKTFRADLARELGISCKQSAPYMPGSMEVSRLVSLIVMPESVAKPGLGEMPEGYSWYLDKMMKDNKRPENDSRYLTHFLPR